MNLRQIFFALLIVLMATIVTASPLNLDQLIKSGPLTYGQTSRGSYTSGTLTQRTAYMAPSRPGYGIPLGDISPMAKIDNSFHWRDITGSN
ncbi:hypothetical protein RhiirA4_484491 [Rhizophagus irregularis]|uniref:Uncharacterized protein n=1 Tax=Rhizophagus irregularis TaxID=588596 RepID=A0A2I1HNZ7_9GLOM|nr:hypothetical protein RhiirA4_484491 [Rhizophagus irregularis]